MKDHCLSRRALDLSKETKMGYLCKTIVDGEPYDYAPHPIQIK